MQAYVYTDKSLERYAGRFVWLSVNTEEAKNAAFLKKWPIPGLPTILILDAKRDTVALRYLGGATLPQLKKLLDDADKTYRARGQSAAEKALVKGDRLAAEGKNEEAVKAFEEALSNAPKNWSSYGRAAEALLFAYGSTGNMERCIQQVDVIYPRVKGTASAANVAMHGLSCAIELPEERPNRVATIEKFEKLARAVFDDPKVEMADDDRSGFYIAFIETRRALKDEEGAKKLTHEWVAFLDDAAARAKTPEQRTVYDSHRMTAYIMAETPEKGIPMLEQSERDFPDDYNPPARLAGIYRTLKQYDKALAASDRALPKVQGPRRLQVLLNRADIYNDMGDKKAARETLQTAIEFAKALPEGQRSERRIASLEKKLQSIQ